MEILIRKLVICNTQYIPHIYGIYNIEYAIRIIFVTNSFPAQFGGF